MFCCSVVRFCFLWMLSPCSHSRLVVGVRVCVCVCCSFSRVRFVRPHGLFVLCVSGVCVCSAHRFSVGCVCSRPISVFLCVLLTRFFVSRSKCLRFRVSVSLYFAFFLLCCSCLFAFRVFVFVCVCVSRFFSLACLVRCFGVSALFSFSFYFRAYATIPIQPAF